MPKKRRKPSKPQLLTGPNRTIATGDLPHNGVAVDVKLDDPVDGVAGHVTKSLRDDPLGRLHARHQITDSMFAAGDYLRAMFELAGDGISVRAMDFSKTMVDSSGWRATPVTPAQQRAAALITRAREALGAAGYQLIREVLGSRKFIEQVARERGLHSRGQVEYLGKRFRECLETLEIVCGHTVIGTGPRTKRDKHTANARDMHNTELHRATRAAADHRALPPVSHRVGETILKLPATDGVTA